MLNYIRERQDALGATPGRRIYNYASGALVLAVMALVFAGYAPIWSSWTTLAASCVLDFFLIRKWIRDDALKAYRADHSG
ncbi:quinol-cytochrome oxidoreductase complex cytochrome b subunit [Arthrobacter sp. UYNi723]